MLKMTLIFAVFQDCSGKMKVAIKILEKNEIQHPLASIVVKCSSFCPTSKFLKMTLLMALCYSKNPLLTNSNITQQ